MDIQMQLIRLCLRGSVFEEKQIIVRLMLIKQMMNKINHPSKFIKSKYKVAVVGPYAAGKTSLVLRFASGSFEQNYHMTLRPSCHNKAVRLEDSLYVRLELIDTLGSGPSVRSPQSPLRDIDAVLLVYDVTNQQSFLKLGEMLSELNASLPKEILYALVGTHCDRPHLREVTPQEGYQLKKQYGISLFFEASARTNENVTELFHDLAKYLVIVGASREKEENPEASTTFEEERLTGGRGAKSAVLEKKLAYKEEECRKLWRDYEEALERISSLEARTKDDSSYILNYAGDTEQLQSRIQQLEQQFENAKTQYLADKTLLEEQHTIAINSYHQKAQSLEVQNERLKADLEKLSKQLTYIETIIQQHEINSTNLLNQKKIEIQILLSEKQALKDEKANLTSLIEEEIQQRARAKIQFESKQAQLLKEIMEKDKYISELEEQKKRLIFLKQTGDAIIEQSELTITAYRQQMVEMHYLQEELALEHEKYFHMETTYEDNLIKMRNEYEAQIDGLRKEKEVILQGKEKVVSKIIESKVNEIKLIKSFIDEIDSKKESSSKGQSALEQQGSTDARLREFFDQFIELIQENSQYLHYNLETLLGSLETVQEECQELLEDTARLDLSEVWYDLKERQQNSHLTTYIQKPEAHQIWCILNLETQKRVAKCISSLEGMLGRVGEAAGDLRTNLSHINDSLEKVNKLSEMGIEAYVQSINS